MFSEERDLEKTETFRSISIKQFDVLVEVTEEGIIKRKIGFLFNNKSTNLREEKETYGNTTDLRIGDIIMI